MELFTKEWFLHSIFYLLLLFFFIFTFFRYCLRFPFLFSYSSDTTSNKKWIDELVAKFHFWLIVDKMMRIAVHNQRWILNQMNFCCYTSHEVIWWHWCLRLSTWLHRKHFSNIDCMIGSIFNKQIATHSNHQIQMLIWENEFNVKNICHQIELENCHQFFFRFVKRWNIFFFK